MLRREVRGVERVGRGGGGGTDVGGDIFWVDRGFGVDGNVNWVTFYRFKVNWRVVLDKESTMSNAPPCIFDYLDKSTCRLEYFTPRFFEPRHLPAEPAS